MGSGKDKLATRVTALEKSLAREKAKRTKAEAAARQAHEQQTAAAEILRVISNSPGDIQPVLDAVTTSAARLCEAQDVSVLRRDGDRLLLVAHYGPIGIAPVGEFELPLSPLLTAGRTVLERRTIHLADVQAETQEFPEAAHYARQFGHRAMLSVPLLKDGVAIGAIALRRTEPQLFSDWQVALLQTFADQAAIAIENVRLLNELQAKNNSLAEALEQQTATSQILQVISRSPTDIQPVLDAVAANAARLCGAQDASIFRRDTDQLRLVARHGPIPFGVVGETEVALTRGTVNGRAVLEARSIQVADLQAEGAEYPEGSALARQYGHRTTLTVPLIRDGLAIGSISLRRTERQPFGDRQIALLQTFADQAVIAIENVRLFTELGTRNDELRIALEQQTATSDLLKVIGRATFDLQPVFQTLADHAARLCEADRALVSTFDGEFLRAAAMHATSPELAAFIVQNPIRPGPGSGLARAALERRAVHILDVQTEPGFTWGVRDVEPIRSVLAVPMVRANELLGVISVNRHVVRPFTESQIALMETFADQAAIAIENARLLTELQTKNASLSEALEQQTATSEILRVISRSPTDIQPVFDIIAERAVSLCEATVCNVCRFDGELVHLAATTSVAPGGVAAIKGTFPMRLGPQSAATRTILTRALVHIPDVLEDSEYSIAPQALASNFRSTLGVPMLRGGSPLGSIVVGRPHPGPFSDKQITLLQTFADQAVIAIENVRLFTELRVRNHELTQA